MSNGENFMKFKTLFAVCAMVLGLGTNAMAEELTVSAAASLTNAFTELKANFESANNGVSVATNFAASNPLLQQIKEGAPADVFATADQDTMNKAQDGKLIDPATRINFVLNTLVMIVPADSKAEIATLDDLKKLERLAVGKPASVPVGRYTRDSLTAAGLWEALESKYIFGQNVRQVLDYVSRGEVDAGFVYATDAKKAGDKVRVVMTMGNHEPVLYPIAVVSASSHKELAQKFVNFVVSPAGMEVLQKHGFMPAN